MRWEWGRASIWFSQLSLFASYETWSDLSQNRGTKQTSFRCHSILNPKLFKHFKGEQDVLIAMLWHCVEDSRDSGSIQPRHHPRFPEKILGDQDIATLMRKCKPRSCHIQTLERQCRGWAEGRLVQTDWCKSQLSSWATKEVWARSPDLLLGLPLHNDTAVQRLGRQLQRPPWAKSGIGVVVDKPHTHEIPPPSYFSSFTSILTSHLTIAL